MTFNISKHEYLQQNCENQVCITQYMQHCEFYALLWNTNYTAGFEINQKSTARHFPDQPGHQFGGVTLSDDYN